jgi:hypothetical protein
MSKKPKRPRDLNQLARSIVDQATADTPIPVPESAKAAAGRKGGQKGGLARSASLSAEQRSEIARKAAQKRWARKNQLP